MESRNSFIFIFILIIFDVFMLNCSFESIYILHHLELAGFDPHIKILFFNLLNVSWLLASIIVNPYKYNNVQTTEALFIRSAYTFIFHVLILSILTYYFLPAKIQNTFIIYTLVLQFFGITWVRICIDFCQKHFSKLKTYKKNIAIIGDENLGLKLEKYFLKNRLSFNLTGYYNSSKINQVDSDDQELNNLKNSINYAISHNLDEVYTTHFPKEGTIFHQILALAEKNCVRVKFVTSFIRYKREQEFFLNSNYTLSSYYDGMPVLVNRVEPLIAVRNRIIKRAFDILFSLAVIIFLLSWLLPIIMILIKLESKGPAIFKQSRSGKDNEPFFCYKFRSMRINEKSDHLQATKNDPRITKLGAFMRKTSIDELPQFFNVLFGNMSIVGPRPHMLKHTEEYSKIIDQYMVRQFLKPGITGWAQINGFRGETKHQDQMLGRVNHDIWYMENWSLRQDIKIIYKTVVNAVTGEENAF